MTGRRYAAVAAIVGAVVVVDQLTKTWAVNALADGPIDVFWTLRFHLSFNSGFAFSMGTGLTPFITVAAVVLVAILLSVTRHATTRLLSVALGLLLGGALGNLTDRLFRSHGGAVVDFIDFQWWPVFNVADMGISIGAVLLVIASFVDDRRNNGELTATADA